MKELSLKSGVMLLMMVPVTGRKGIKLFNEGLLGFISHSYTGNHEVFTPFKHRGAKNFRRTYIRSAPFVKEKVNKYFKKVILISSKVQGSILLKLFMWRL